MRAAECGVLATAHIGADGEDVLARRLRRMAARLAAARPDGPACEVATYGRCPPGQAATVQRAAGLLIGLALRQGPAWDGGAVVVVIEADADGGTALRIAHGQSEPPAAEVTVVLESARRLARAHGGWLRIHRGVVTTTELVLPPPLSAGPAGPVAAAGAPSLDARLARAERFEVTVISLVFVALVAAMAAVTLCQGARPGWGASPARSVCVGGMLVAGTRCPVPG